jgi:transcriptional regulator of acetoin/glycerol metabolism
MPPSRASANELGKLLGVVVDPIYVVASNRKIVFVNDALAKWAEVAADGLLGSECTYGVAAEVSGSAATVAALCPPPEAFNGARLKAPLVLPGKGEEGRREAEFIPLAAEDDRATAVLVMVSPLGNKASAPPADDLSGPDLHARLQHYRDRLAILYHRDRLLGDSPAMRQVRSQVRLAAGSPTNVLVLGPPGSGREHVGRAIHYGDGISAAGPLIPLSCPLLDNELLEATVRSLSRNKSFGLRPATLLLNEIDQLSEGVQADLVGSVSSGTLIARVISTSHQPLVQLAARGSFRMDLACLLSTLTIQLPALSARLADLPLLVQWYIEQANLGSPKQRGGCTPEALDRLAGYSWPNDLRELEEVIVESHRRAEGPLISSQDLPPRLMVASQATARPAKVDERIVLEKYLAGIEHELIVRALKRAKGNKTKAARLLGMNRPRFYRRLMQLGLAEA